MGIYQNYVLKCMCQILSWHNSLSGAERESTTRKVMKDVLNDMVRHYPEVIEVVRPGAQREIAHVWVKHLPNNMLPFFHRPFLMSEQAYKIVQRGSLEEIRDGLYQEHITPVKYIIERLLDLGEDAVPDSVSRCFDQNNLVLLKNGEQKYLDGKRFSHQDIEFFVDLVGEEHRDFAVSFLGKSCRSNGPGLLRMCKLRNAGISGFYDWNKTLIEPKNWKCKLSGSDFVVEVSE